jgi:hypothetical protein
MHATRRKHRLMLRCCVLNDCTTITDASTLAALMQLQSLDLSGRGSINNVSAHAALTAAAAP